jgi:hypothetical protein
MIVSRVINEFDTLCLKVEEIKNDFEKRITPINFDSEINKMIISNSKQWLFNTLSISVNDISGIFEHWKENAQKNIDSNK